MNYFRKLSRLSPTISAVRADYFEKLYNSDRQQGTGDVGLRETWGIRNESGLTPSSPNSEGLALHVPGEGSPRICGGSKSLTDLHTLFETRKSFDDPATRLLPPSSPAFSGEATSLY